MVKIRILVVLLVLPSIAIFPCDKSSAEQHAIVDASVFPLAIQSDTDPLTERVAEHLKLLFRVRTVERIAIDDTTTPSCWFFVRRGGMYWYPDDKGSYLILVGAHGSVFQFSDAEGSQKGIEALKRMIDFPESGAPRLPRGVLTNLPFYQ